ncbi:TIGR03943 family putative permease subunit [Umezawaea beigongshangensis]|uniref:TIGR03943 family putative permease subunit n=1 Tax=Umezawaea beigongshangensis TaxID=2780383 RepID=UPI0018F23B45|nr:TIGR03943 family protein [Umezawaea beigongshangensis]
MRRETQNILLVLFGGALLKLALTGTYLRYVKPALQPWLVLTGVVMVLLAVVAIGRDLVTSRTGAAPPAGDHDDHGDHGGHGGSRSPWLLLLPVLAVFLISPPALGADTVSRSADSNTNRSEGAAARFAPLPGGDVVPMTVTDFVTRTAWDDSGSLDGRTVRLVGFVVRQDGVTHVARLVIACCAADASPVKVRLDGAGVDALVVDEWIEVTGEAVPGSATEETGYVPTFRVERVVPTAAPETPYEF